MIPIWGSGLAVSFDATTPPLFFNHLTLHTMKFNLIKEILPLFNVQELTKEEVLNHECKDYNPYEWNRAVEGICRRQTNVRFFEKTSNKMSYSELFALYTTSEGINFFKEFGYGGSLTNAGFSIVIVDGNMIKTLKPFEEGFIANNKQGRDYMVKMSAHGNIYTNSLPLSKLITEEVEI